MTGSGKSTLVQALLRLLEAEDGGRILVDGVASSDCSSHFLDLLLERLLNHILFNM